MVWAFPFATSDNNGMTRLRLRLQPNLDAVTPFALVVGQDARQKTRQLSASSPTARTLSEIARKQVIIGILVFVMVFLLVGCSGDSYKITVGEITSSDNNISGDYSSFNGYYYKSVRFKKGENVDFNILIKTDSGEISAKLIDSNGNTVAELDSDKQIEIRKTEKYKIQVEGEQHKGSFMITWEKQE